MEKEKLLNAKYTSEENSAWNEYELETYFQNIVDSRKRSHDFEIYSLILQIEKITGVECSSIQLSELNYVLNATFKNMFENRWSGK